MMVLTSLQNPRVKRVVKLRDRRSRERERAFLIEGYRELRRAVERGLPLEEVFYSPSLYLGENESELLEAASERSGARLTETASHVFEKLSYRDRPDGLLAVAAMPLWTLEQIPTSSAGLYVIACAIEKPGNLGTILRCADAVAASGVIVCDRCTDVFNPNVVRASVGTLFSVPVAEATGEETLAWLSEHDIATVATTPGASRVYTDADLTGAIAIVLGSEQYGLDERWLAKTDVQVSIPMAGSADSLNVAMATAVILFEARRQRDY